jgi:hypothetical protein
VTPVIPHCAIDIAAAEKDTLVRPPLNAADNRKAYIAAAGVANLSLLRLWSETLSYTAADAYTMKLPPSPGQFGAIFIALGVLFAVFSALILWGKRSRTGQIVFLLTLALPLNAIREVLSNQVAYLRGDLIRAVGTAKVEYAAATIAVIGIVALIKLGPSAYRLAVACGAIVSPLVPITSVQAIAAMARYDDTAFRDRPMAQPVTQTAPRRVVWIVFDELDQRLTFDQRPSGLAMPEFDGFRSSALYATTAYSPTSGTLSSLPSLITGNLVENARPAGAADLRLSFAANAGHGEVRWSDEPNVFTKARAAGFNSALVGWYHPYCRELGRDLTSCSWTAMPMQADSVGRTVLEAAPKYLRSLFETSMLSPFGQSLSTKEAAARFQTLLRQALRNVADPSVGLVFLHLPVPHGPHAYDRRKGDFSLYNAPVTGYVDSLALADITLGQIRRAMQEASLWDSTAVVVSSDHCYRSARALYSQQTDRRVPFLLKLGSRNEGRVYTGKFNTVISADLIMGILRGDLTSFDAVSAWIDHVAVATNPSTNANRPRG